MELTPGFVSHVSSLCHTVEGSQGNLKLKHNCAIVGRWGCPFNVQVDIRLGLNVIQCHLVFAPDHLDSASNLQLTNELYHRLHVATLHRATDEIDQLTGLPAVVTVHFLKSTRARLETRNAELNGKDLVLNPRLTRHGVNSLLDEVKWTARRGHRLHVTVVDVKELAVLVNLAGIWLHRIVGV